MEGDSNGVVDHAIFVDNFKRGIDNMGYGVVVYGDGQWETAIQPVGTHATFLENSLFVGNRHAIATALLDHALNSARASGYERCAVPFEPMNLLGTHFWLKYFKPVCFSVVRHIDDRMMQV